MAGEEKTEKATPKKRRDSRKKGEVLQSKEVSNAVFIVGIFVFLSIFGSTMFTMLLDYMQQCLEGLSETGNSTEFVMNVMWKVFFICICTVGRKLRKKRWVSACSLPKDFTTFVPIRVSDKLAEMSDIFSCKTIESRRMT